MPEPAQSREGRAARSSTPSFENEIKRGHAGCKVQFNPETLKVTFANQIAARRRGAATRRGTPARQFVGAGTTKLALQLWFDVTAPRAEGEPRSTTCAS